LFYFYIYFVFRRSNTWYSPYHFFLSVRWMLTRRYNRFDDRSVRAFFLPYDVRASHIVTQLRRHILPSGYQTERCITTWCILRKTRTHNRPQGVSPPYEMSFEMLYEFRAMRFSTILPDRRDEEAHTRDRTQPWWSVSTWPRKSGSIEVLPGGTNGFQFL